VLWVIVFVAIAVAGLVMVVCYALWLAHKSADLWSEVVVLTDRAGQLAELMGQIQPPPVGAAGPGMRDLATVASPSDSAHIDVR
jgi:hypothetical protein